MHYTNPMEHRSLHISLALVALFGACDSLLGQETPDARPVQDDAQPLNTADAAPDHDGAPVPDAVPTSIDVDYTRLSETGLYSDIDNKVLAEGIIEYAPEYRHWLDGARSRTWIWVPPGGVIDTSDMDYWNFPLGTKVWHQVSTMSGGDELLLETRFIQRIGLDDDDVWQGSFVWNNSETEANFAENGAYNVRGTTHDVPRASFCNSCHRGQPSHIIGFAAVSLSYNASVNINTLYADGLLSHGPETPDMYPIPGDAIERDALGYMHADCAHCHTSGLGLGAYGVTGFSTRLFTAARTVEETELYLTGVDQPMMFWFGSGLPARIASGVPEDSAVLFRTGARGGRAAMPPEFTDIANQDAVEALTAWIERL